MDPSLILAGLGLLVLLLVLAFYLMLRKPKIIGERILPAWLGTLSVSARNVHLKEFNKEVGRKFSKQWLFGYWHGQRSAFYAWFTWFFIGRGTLAVAIFTSTLVLASRSGNEWILMDHPVFLIGTGIILLAYMSVSAIILWRCAVNSRPVYKYIARIYAILAPIYFLAKVFASNF